MGIVESIYSVHNTMNNVNNILDVVYTQYYRVCGVFIILDVLYTEYTTNSTFHYQTCTRYGALYADYNVNNSRLISGLKMYYT